jgi:hypothetical protein
LPAYEDEAKRHTIALSTKVSVIKLDVSAAPPNLEIRINSKLIAPTDYARVEVDRGMHNLEAHAPGKEPFEVEIEVKGDDAGTITIPALEDDSRVIDIGVPAEPVEPSHLGRQILAGGFGVVGLGLAIGAPLWARSTKRAYDDAVARGEMPSYSTARNKQHIATGMFVAGLGAIAFGTYLYLTIPSGSTPTPTTAIVPVLDGQHIGFAISGAL